MKNIQTAQTSAKAIKLPLDGQNFDDTSDSVSLSSRLCLTTSSFDCQIVVGIIGGIDFTFEMTPEKEI